ncbi:conserved hypothetical protein [Methylocella silvestris BL2]|uniref:Phosphate starvation-inducible protein PsiF n=1 Tax=Methylocella silvestris (strain DSM 15510 / CIP 108128 / LMG 27833 / NCIMB 13906 / BL2) TaxID=395965 RepID=B8ETS9_METSB|nr:PsiF family protein [Methylocella silvestris]ACK52431.1 conserved hypothetical protein [Methylocella silvestris BL2]
MKLMLSSLLAGSLILSSVAVGFAQQTPAAAPASPAAAPAAASKPSGLSDDAKKAKAKECSTQADAKGLHGKERKAFRQKCKQS